MLKDKYLHWIIWWRFKSIRYICWHNYTEMNFLQIFISDFKLSIRSIESTSSQRRNGTNLKLAERYICHRVPSGPWSGRMKLWEPERTRSLFGEGETNRHSRSLCRGTQVEVMPRKTRAKKSQSPWWQQLTRDIRYLQRFKELSTKSLKICLNTTFHE